MNKILNFLVILIASIGAAIPWIIFLIIGIVEKDYLIGILFFVIPYIFIISSIFLTYREKTKNIERFEFIKKKYKKRNSVNIKNKGQLTLDENTNGQLSTCDNQGKLSLK